MSAVKEVERLGLSISPASIYRHFQRCSLSRKKRPNEGNLDILIEGTRNLIEKSADVMKMLRRVKHKNLETEALFADEIMKTEKVMDELKDSLKLLLEIKRVDKQEKAFLSALRRVREEHPEARDAIDEAISRLIGEIPYEGHF